MERFGLEKEYSKNMLDLSRKELDIEKLNFTGEQFQQNVMKVLTEFRSEFEKGFLELDKTMLSIERGSFSNQAESAKLELQTKYQDVQNQLRSLYYERQDLDLSYREQEVDLGEEYNRVQEQVLNNERIMDKINFEKRELDSQSKMDDMKFRFQAAMDNARYQYHSQMENSRNQMAGQQQRLEQEAMRNSSLQLQNTGLKETISSLYRYNRNK